MKTVSTIIRTAAAVIAALALLCMSACSFPVSMCALPAPTDAVTGFVSAYRAGDSELLAEYTYGYDDIVLDDLDDSEYHAKLYALLRDNFSIQQVGSAVTDGKSATIPVAVTCFDLRRLTEVLTESTTTAALEYTKQHQSLEDEESVMALLCTVIDELTADASVYCTTEYITLSLRYDDGWRVCIDDTLYSMLTGYIA